MLNTATPFLKSDAPIPHTFTSLRQNTSHLDYIFTSFSLSHDPTSYKILNDSTTILTALTISLFLSRSTKITSSNKPHQHTVNNIRLPKHPFVNDKTSLLQWDFFSERADKLIRCSSSYKLCVSTDISANQSTLNNAWEFFSTTVMTATNKYLPK